MEINISIKLINEPLRVDLDMDRKRKALATIRTDLGRMTLYFNGADEEMTGEIGDYVEGLDYVPDSLNDAIEMVTFDYAIQPCWRLEWIDEGEF